MDKDIKFPLKVEELESYIKSKFENNSDEDLMFSIYHHQNKKIAVFGIRYLIDSNNLGSYLLSPLLERQTTWTADALLNELPFENGSSTNNLDDILDKIILGFVYLYIEDEQNVICYSLMQEEERSLDKSETESVIIGPQLSFTESLKTNLNVMRQILPTADLVIEKIMVGNAIPREVRIVYLKSVANKDDVNTMRQRIEEVDVEELEDSTTLSQYISDSTYSLFPQFYLTELPAHLAYTIKEGKIGVMVENSPNAFIGPSTFFSFFETTEDTYLEWLQATSLRILRLVSIPLALFLTPLYVAILTYRYELVPSDLIITIGQSRAGVPFPPIIEALLIELMIELLREAGARLPTKIGQTMGIVGGIVIGQAAVDAGLTSNVLIIIVAASALASFTTPNYLIGTSFRVIRFPLIILAGLYGLIGLIFGFCLLVIHLLTTESLGRPYLAPLYPLRLQDFKRVFFRVPPSHNYRRASMYRPRQHKRYSKQDASKIRNIKK